jgi:hypothetical protein
MILHYYLLFDYFTEHFTVLAGLAAGFKWVWEYIKQLRVEKTRYLVEQIEKFESKHFVKDVEKMLDWNSFKTEIFNKIDYIDDEIIMKALITHDIKDVYTEKEFYIREIFDKYFDEINKFIILTECGLINKSDLKKLLGYWFDIISGKKTNKSKEFISSLHTYLAFYGYEKVLKFIK